MSDWMGDIINTVKEASFAEKFRGIKLAPVKSVKPFIFEINGLDVGCSLGDTVYIHPLFLSELVNFDENSLLEIQNFKNTTAYNSPQFQGIIEGTIPDFIKEFYLFYKNKESIYLIKEGDFVIVYEFGGNTYLVLQKVLPLIEDTKETVK